MVVTVPLFIISIALFLLALGALVDDRRAWTRRLVVAAEPLGPAPPRRELGSDSLVQQLRDELVSIDEQTTVALAPRTPRTAAAAPASGRSHAGPSPQDLVSQPARRSLPPPFPPSDRLKLAEAATEPLPASARVRSAGARRSPPQPSTGSTTDEVTLVNPRASTSPPPEWAGAPALAPRPRAGAPAVAPRPRALAEASLRFPNGTPPPLGSRPAFPVVHSFPLFSTPVTGRKRPAR